MEMEQITKDSLLDIDVVVVDSCRPSEINQVRVYSSSGRLSRLEAMTTVGTVPCSTWCRDTSETTWMMRYVGNDIERAKSFRQENLDKALQTACKQCSEKHFLVVEVMDHHIDMLRCVQGHDDKGQLRAARERGRLLHQLGFRIA